MALDNCPACGDVLPVPNTRSVYYSWYMGSLVASLEFLCPSPTHPTDELIEGCLPGSRYVRKHADSQVATSTLIRPETRAVFLRDFQSDETHDLKRNCSTPFLSLECEALIANYLSESVDDVFQHTLQKESLYIEPKKTTLFRRVRNKLKRPRNSP